MLIPRRTVRTSQPQSAVGINRQSSLSAGLGGLFDVANARELVYDNPAANVSSLRVISKAGQTADFSATANQQYTHRPGYAPLGDFTLFALFELDTLTNYTHIISKQGTTTSDAPYELRIGSGPTDNNINLVRANASSYAPRSGSAGAINVSSQPQTLAIVGGLVESRATVAYVNGKAATTLSNGPDGATGLATDTGANVWIGRRYDSATQLDGRIYYVAVWNRQLSVVEIEALHANPWQIFEDEEDYLFIPAAGGGGSVSLIVADALHGHAVDSPSFSMATYLAVAESLHAHTADNVTLTTTGTANLVVQEATHAHVADGVSLTTQWLLAVAEALHSHTAESVTLSLQTALVVLEALHTHAAENLTLDTSNATALTVQDSTHAHGADNLGLSLDTWLAIVEAAHGHTADAPMLSLGQLSLQIADALHAMYSDIVFLTLPGGNLTTDQKFIIRATARRLAAIGLARKNIINRRAS